MIENQSRLYWVAFTLVKGIGAVRFRALLEYFGSAENAWQAPGEALREAGLGQKLVENLLKVRSQVVLEKVWQQIESQGIQVLTWEDQNYPPRLKQVEQPPPVLYLRGDLRPEDDWAVAVVGTRRITAYGQQVAEDVAATLARAGVTVVSGLARGVDGVAHQSALKAGGRTVAILGSGVDHIYPPEHTRLAEQMIARGGVMSDYPPGTPPDAANFPPRNRIISGMSMATVIVEAGIDSGAMITARFAIEQGREVFAVPGNIYGAQSQGPNRLIREGARPLLNPKDLLEALNLNQVVEHRTARSALPTDPVEALLYQLIGAEPVYIDELRAQAGMPIEKVTAALAMMELKGMVRQVGGMNYTKIRDAQADYVAAGES